MQNPGKSCSGVFNLFLAFFVLLPLGGCSKTAAQKNIPSSFLHLALSEDPTTLDPALITDVATGSVSAKIFDGLVRFDMQGKIQPCLAQSWELEGGGKVYVFKLRDNAVFHNGRKVTSQDVKLSFERLLNPATASPRRWVLEKIAGAKEYKGGSLAGIQTPDNRTVRITLESPYAPFLSLLAMPNAAVLSMEEVSRLGPLFGQHPVGTGPFSFATWERDKVLLLKKNARYFSGAPEVDGVEYRIIPEPWAALTEFTQGKLDWIAVPQSHMEEFLSDPALASRLKSSVGLNTYYLGFNCQKPPLDRAKVRKALAMAVDRQKIAAKLMKQRAIAAAGPIPPALDAQCAEIPAIPYDPVLAEQWLKEEGVSGLKLTLYQASSQDTQEVMEVVQNYLARAGVQVEIVQREWSAFKEAVIKGEPDMFFLSWWADYPDPENFLFPNFFSGNFGAGGNKTRFSDATFDALITQASKEENSQERSRLYRRCVERIMELSPWIFLWHRTEWVIAQPWVRGLEMGTVYNADKFTSVRLERPARP